MLESPNEEYLLSPSYYLINTGIHVDDTVSALDKGLFKDGYKPEVFMKKTHQEEKHIFVNQWSTNGQ